ncbi:ENTH-domain-containing protein [Auriscalpium vulgare]|uniref:ENTH-domain-containing protein n=1 Tax=Auriscalpium vulgare TaxID=40419 RepID=A0ACB8S7K0_9AGAM|nr:ENTH-domain-containing protein [Auriscalpium vulgare]
MSIQNFGKGALRVAKNYTKGYSDVQSKVREATSNDPWGPSGTQMNEIAQMTYNQNDFVEIMEMLDKRLNDKGKNWRHVFKSLTVLDYLLHAGSENVVVYFRDNVYIIKTLKEFQFVDEYGKDQGANVRQKAKDITNLLADDSRLRQERRSRANMRDRMLGEGEEDDGAPKRYSPPPRPEDENVVRRGANGGKPDDDLRKAIEASKRSLAEDQARTAEERDLQAAIKASQEEEERRKRAINESGGTLFDDQSNNLLLDTEPQFNNVQPQFTSMAPQFTSFNPYQQQAQQEAMQAEYARQQQEWMRQQQEAAQLQAQQEEWMRQQQLLQLQQEQQQQQALQQQQYLQQQQQLAAQQNSFASNNPFALSTAAPAAQTPSPRPPQSSLSNFALPSTYDQHQRTTDLSSFSPSPQPQPQPQPSRSPQPPKGPTRADQQHANLANLFAAPRDDGLDTFGNIGQLRYGHTDAGRIVAQKTGAPQQASFNPFAPQQQQQQHQQQSDQPFFSI